MCRLFGQHADPGQDLREPLCSARNALRAQSHQHPHGWGIGWYEDGQPRVRRGIAPAHADQHFARAARRARSRVVVAHVRDASVGPVRPENTHPFLHDTWLFAHNGTVAHFRRSARVRSAVEAEIDPALRACIRGETDSERLFYLFLTRLAARASTAEASLEHVRSALAEVLSTVARVADTPSAPPSSLNVLVSDGCLLAACRRGRSLHAALRTEPSGLFAVASEPIGRGGWAGIPEGGFIGIDGEQRVLEAPLHGAATGSGGRAPSPDPRGASRSR